MSRSNKISLKNLFILCDRNHFWADFQDIGKRIIEQANDVAVHILPSHFSAEVVPVTAWQHPSITVSFVKHFRFIPSRGPVFHNRSLSKLYQYQVFQNDGIPSPHVEIHSPEKRYEEDVWGQFVVIKPADLRLTSNKDNVRLVRTQHLNHFGDDLNSLLGYEPGTKLLIQSFIDTGRNPQHYRVLTLFAEPLYAQHKTLHQPRPDLAQPDEVLLKAVVSDGSGEATREYGDYPDVVVFARKIASAFDEIPLLGIDILMEVPSEKLFALEVNAGGNTWHFSSPSSARRRAQFPEQSQAMKEQFSAFDVAARALIRQTRLYAA